MPRSASFLNKEPADLEEFLLQLARQDAAPDAARERALRNVVAATAGVGLLSAVSSSGTSTSTLKMTGWLAGKWLAAGLAGGLLSIGAAHVVAQHTSGANPSLSADPSLSPALMPARGARHGRSPKFVAATESDAPAVATQTAPLALEPTASPTTLPGSAAASVGAAHEGSGRPMPSAPLATSHASAAASPAPASSLSRELGMLESARRALAEHAPSEANAALDAYASEFPNGSLQVEAAALRVEAVGQSGHTARARELAESFLNAHPTSPLAGRVRAAAQSFRRETWKP